MPNYTRPGGLGRPWWTRLNQTRPYQAGGTQPFVYPQATPNTAVPYNYAPTRETQGGGYAPTALATPNIPAGYVYPQAFPNTAVPYSYAPTRETQGMGQAAMQTPAPYVPVLMRAGADAGAGYLPTPGGPAPTAQLYTSAIQGPVPPPGYDFNAEAAAWAARQGQAGAGGGGGGFTPTDYREAPPGVNAGWYRAFQDQHAGKTPEEFYQETEGWSSKASALAEAIADASWGSEFQKMTGRAPSQGDWENHYYSKYGYPSSGSYRGERRAERREARHGKEWEEERQKRRKEPEARSRQYIPPQNQRR